MYFREQPEGVEVTLDSAGLSLGVSTVLAISAAAVIVLGLYPSPLITSAQNALRHVLG
jgi:NADH:ubiquinone oxidoreductase subunit 2 (subunit N)